MSCRVVIITIIISLDSTLMLCKYTISMKTLFLNKSQGAHFVYKIKCNIHTVHCTLYCSMYGFGCKLIGIVKVNKMHFMRLNLIVYITYVAISYRWCMHTIRFIQSKHTVIYIESERIYMVYAISILWAFIQISSLNIFLFRSSPSLPYFVSNYNVYFYHL